MNWNTFLLLITLASTLGYTPLSYTAEKEDPLSEAFKNAVKITFQIPVNKRYYPNWYTAIAQQYKLITNKNEKEVLDYFLMQLKIPSPHSFKTTTPAGFARIDFYTNQVQKKRLIVSQELLKELADQFDPDK